MSFGQTCTLVIALITYSAPLMETKYRLVLKGNTTFHKKDELNCLIVASNYILNTDKNNDFIFHFNIF